MQTQLYSNFNQFRPILQQLWIPVCHFSIILKNVCYFINNVLQFLVRIGLNLQFCCQNKERIKLVRVSDVSQRLKIDVELFISDLNLRQRQSLIWFRFCPKALSSQRQ